MKHTMQGRTRGMFGDYRITDGPIDKRFNRIMTDLASAYGRPGELADIAPISTGHKAFEGVEPAEAQAQIEVCRGMAPYVLDMCLGPTPKVETVAAHMNTWRKNAGVTHEQYAVVVDIVTGAIAPLVGQAAAAHALEFVEVSQQALDQLHAEQLAA